MLPRQQILIQAENEWTVFLNYPGPAETDRVKISRSALHWLCQGRKVFQDWVEIKGVWLEAV